jgi:hypothetical protein
MVEKKNEKNDSFCDLKQIINHSVYLICQHTIFALIAINEEPVIIPPYHFFRI